MEGQLSVRRQGGCGKGESGQNIQQWGEGGRVRCLLACQSISTDAPVLAFVRSHVTALALRTLHKALLEDKGLIWNPFPSPTSPSPIPSASAGFRLTHPTPPVRSEITDPAETTNSVVQCVCLIHPCPQPLPFGSFTLRPSLSAVSFLSFVPFWCFCSFMS